MVECKVLNILDIVDNKYYIYSDGRIQNIKTGYFLSYFYSDGYAMVSLSTNHGRKTFKVHRLVALNFLPPPLPGQIYIHHIDHNRANPSVDNLMWVTPSQNNLDRYYDNPVGYPSEENRKNLFSKQKYGECNPTSKYKDADMIRIAQNLYCGMTRKDAIISAGLEFTPQLLDVVKRMHRGERWQHIGRIFGFAKVNDDDIVSNNLEAGLKPLPFAINLAKLQREAAEYY